MHPQTLQSFEDEMRKMAMSDEQESVLFGATPSERRVTKALAATFGANTAAGGITLALMKGGDQPATEAEMKKYVKEMASKMEGPSKLDVKTPSAGFDAHFDSSTNSVSAPVGARDAIIAHEIGHSKDWDALQKTPIGKVYDAIQTGSRLGSMLALVPTTVMAAKDEKMSYKPGVIQAILSSPMLLEEAAASTRATAHLVEQHGIGKGLFKSLPLLPAFASYATIAGAPLLVTYVRRRLAAKALAEKLSKEKKSSSRVASRATLAYSSR
jgi:hypothetical protein